MVTHMEVEEVIMDIPMRMRIITDIVMKTQAMVTRTAVVQVMDTVMVGATLKS
jgi:hypothetical protein